MMDIAALRPSQIEQLIASISDEDIKDILEGIADLLDSFESDGGAESDKIYMAAHLLSMTPIWTKVGAHELAEVLLSSDVRSRSEFLKGLPNEYAKNVSYLMETKSFKDEVEDSVWWAAKHLGLVMAMENNLRSGVVSEHMVAFPRMASPKAFVHANKKVGKLKPKFYGGGVGYGFQPGKYDVILYEELPKTRVESDE